MGVVRGSILYTGQHKVNTVQGYPSYLDDLDLSV